MNRNIIANLIDTIIKDNRAATWSDSEIIDKLIDCGLEEKDFVEYGFEDFVEDYFNNDDNDFLQDLIDEECIEETINIWLDMLLEATGKTTTDELTVEEVRAEIEEVQGTISNERMWALAEDIHYENIEQLAAYLKVLEEMLNDKEAS